MCVFYHNKKFWKKEKIPHQNLWDTANAVLREKFITQTVSEKKGFNSVTSRNEKDKGKLNLTKAEKRK